MKKNLKNLTLGLVIIGSLFACKKEEDNDSGDPRDAFIGTWTVTAVGTQTQTRIYDVTIKKDANFPSRVNIFNFYKFGKDSVIANISAIQTNTITVPNQTLKGHKINGQGKLENSQKFTLNYSVNDGTDIDDVTATYNR